MAVFQVSYDLNSPGRDYKQLYQAFASVPNCHALDSTWLLEVSKTAAELRDALRAYIDENDMLLVTRIPSDAWATYNVGCSAWLKAPERIW